MVSFLCDLLNLEENNWTFAREKLLSRADLHKELADIDKTKISSKLLKRLELFCTDGFIAAEIEDYQVMYHNSKAAALVYIWLQGIVAFCDVRRRTKIFTKKIDAMQAKIDTKQAYIKDLSKQLKKLDNEIALHQTELTTLQSIIENHQLTVAECVAQFEDKKRRLKVMFEALKSIHTLYPDLTSENILKESVEDVEKIFHQREIQQLNSDNLQIIRHFIELMKMPVLLIDEYDTLNQNDQKYLHLSEDDISSLTHLKETEEFPNKNQIYWFDFGSFFLFLYEANLLNL